MGWNAALSLLCVGSATTTTTNTAAATAAAAAATAAAATTLEDQMVLVEGRQLRAGQTDTVQYIWYHLEEQMVVHLM